MSAALVSAIRDLTGMCKGFQSPGSDLQQQMLALERQINSQLGQYKIPSVVNISATARAPSLGGSNHKHHVLTHSNSVTVPTAACVKNSNHRKLDRSISEPVERQTQQQLRPAQTNSSRYKTELCRPFEESGTCKYGDKCQFAHGINELRTLARHPKYKTELCRTFHTTGFCPYGPRCHFIHNDVAKNFVVANIPTGSISIPSAVGGGQRHSSGDMGSFSYGSTGELSPNCSSVSGSPTSSNGFYAEDSTFSSPVSPVPQTAPPFLTNAGFFDQDFVVPFSNVMPNTTPPDVLERQAFLNRRNIANCSPPLDGLSASLDNLNLSDGPCCGTSSLIDINRNLRLPIFNRLAFSGID